MGRSSRALTLVLALLVTAAVAAPALAHEHRITDREHVFDGMLHEEFSTRLGDGSVARGNILRFRQDDPYLKLGSTMARDQVAGLETTPSMALRERSNNALAGTNGGFGLPRPFGAANGFTVQDGILLGAHGQTRNGHRRARGTVGVQPTGELILDRVRVDTAWPQRPESMLELRYDGPSGTETIRIEEVNLQPRLDGEVNVPSGELILYDELFGTPIEVPADSRVIVVEDLRLGPGGWESGIVRDVWHTASDTTVRVAAGTSVLVAHGTAVDRVREVILGLTVSVRARPVGLFGTGTAWETVRSSVPGGPLLIGNGRRTDLEEWESEGFCITRCPGEIIFSRHPRTAIGLTDDGEVLMVTVDGRRPDHSVGMTMRELQRFLEGLGARYALNLDGGGSTTMTVEGAVRNWPSETGRSVPNALFVYHSYPFDGTRRISGGNRFATAAAISSRSHPDGADEVVIATGAAFPDALAGGPLATLLDAPLLLTNHDHLPTATRNALDRLAPSSAVILGGTAAVSDDVRRALEDRGISVRRISGPDRSGTAATIGHALVGRSDLDRVFLATGAGFADALSAAAPAGMLTAPILLTGRDELPAATRDFLRERQVNEVVIVGGTAVVSRTIESALADIDGEMGIRRLAGGNRFGTAREVNEWAAGAVPDHDAAGLLVANGTNFPDALAGGPLGAKRGNLLMIVPPKDALADPDAAAYLGARGDGPLERITLLGGRIALTSYQQWQLDQIAIR